MNKIEVKDSVLNKDIVLNEDCILIYNSCSGNINYKVSNNIKVFIYLETSNISFNFDINKDFKLNIFSYDCTLNIDLNLNKKDIDLNYVYSTVNNKDNNYLININHNYEGINSNIINNGLNLSKGKLNFIVNAIVPKKITGVKTNQNNKIIVMNKNNCKIEPNLLIDNDDIEASHSAYLGKFKDSDIFYLKSRGLDEESSVKLLSRSFIMGSMDISYIEKNIILDKLDMYWR